MILVCQYVDDLVTRIDNIILNLTINLYFPVDKSITHITSSLDLTLPEPFSSPGRMRHEYILSINTYKYRARINYKSQGFGELKTN